MENEIKVIRGFAVSMGNDYVDFFKNPDSYEVYVTVKFGIWKVAEISRFPSPADILHGNIIEYTENRHMCSEKDIKEIEEFTINNVINTILK